jgi:hypothetical protein
MKLYAVCCFVLLFLAGCSSHSVKRGPEGLQFRLRAKDVRSVVLHCSLDGYLPRRASVEENGVWVVTVPAGHAFRYFYVVDGKVLTPDCRFKERDDFGNENCLYVPFL